jgi:hypothetical protein
LEEAEWGLRSEVDGGFFLESTTLSPSSIVGFFDFFLFLSSFFFFLGNTSGENCSSGSRTMP